MKTRLLITVSRLLHGGIDTLLIEYLKHFDPHKFQITLGIGICMEELEKHAAEIPSHIRVEYLVKGRNLVRFRKMKVKGGLPVACKLWDEAVLNPVRRRIQSRNLKKLVRQNDVVLDFDSSFYSFLKSCPVPTIAFFHFSFRHYCKDNPGKLNRLGRKMEVYDKIITTCNDMKTEAEELFPGLREKFMTVYNSFNFASIRAKASAPIEINHPYVLAIQRLEESQKDNTTLLKAFKIVTDRCCLPHKLHLIGDGKERQALEKLAGNLGLADKVVFQGFLPNPFPWMKHCDLFVLSSKSEGFGNVLVEAMVLGKPVVSTDCPIGPAEILDHGKAGILVPVNDENRLAEAICTVLSEPALRNEILLRASVQVEKFNVENNIRIIEELVFKMIS